jgi:hypothetical protein
LLDREFARSCAWISALDRKSAIEISSILWEVDKEYWYDRIIMGAATATTSPNKRTFFLEIVPFKGRSVVHVAVLSYTGKML